MHNFYVDGHDFFSAAAQVLPVLLLAIVFESRALKGTGPNVYTVFGLPVMMTAAPRWFLRSYAVVLLLMPVSLLAGEAAALHALTLTDEGRASWYWTVGGLVIGGLFVLLPFVGEGVTGVFVRNEHALGTKMRFLFAFSALAFIAYFALGLVLLAS